MAKSKEKDKEDIPPLYMAADPKFMSLQDTGFSCPEQDLHELIGIMLSHVKNYSLTEIEEEPGEHEDLEEGGAEGGSDNADETQSKTRKSPPQPLNTTKVFNALGRSIGTHSIKLSCPRAKEHILKVDGAKPMAFPNSKLSGLVKVFFRQIAVGDGPVTSIFDEIMATEKGGNAGPLLAAAYEVIGAELIESFREGIREKRVISAIHRESVPIIFLPSHDGGDIQITPVSPAVAYRVMDDLCWSYRQPHEYKDGKITKRNKRAPFSETVISSQIQNVSVMISSAGARKRMIAEFPDIMREYDAAIHAFIASKGKRRFPSVRHPALEGMISGLSDMLEAMTAAGRKPEMVQAAQNIATSITSIIVDHVSDIVSEILKDDPDFKMPKINIKQVLNDGYYKSDRPAELIKEDIRRILAEKISTDEIEKGQSLIDELIGDVSLEVQE